MNPKANEINKRFYRRLKLIAVFAFFIGLGLFMVSSILSNIASKDVKESHELSTHSYQVLVTLNELQSQLQSIQNHSRGYILTGDSIFKNGHRTLVSNAEQSASSLETLLKERADKSVNIGLAALNKEIERLAEHTSELIAWRDAGEMERIEKAVSSLKGKKIMDATMLEISLIREAEQQWLKNRQRSSERVYILVDQFNLATTILASAFLLVAFSFIYSSLRKKEALDKAATEETGTNADVFPTREALHLNYERLVEGSLGDAGFMKEMLTGYLDYVPALVDELEKCELPDDEANLRSVAHRLRSSAQVVEIVNITSDLEHMELYKQAGLTIEELRNLQRKVCHTYRLAFTLVQEKIEELETA